MSDHAQGILADIAENGSRLIAQLGLPETIRTNRGTFERKITWEYSDAAIYITKITYEIPLIFEEAQK